MMPMQGVPMEAMLMNNPQQFFQQMMQQNPQFANNSQAQNFADIVARGDMAAGEEFAMNMIQSYGMTKDQAIQQAQQYMQQMMGQRGPQPFMRR